MKRRALVLLSGALIAAALTGCGHRGQSVLPATAQGQMVTPQSLSPADIPPAPMAKTQILPPSAMHSPIAPMSAILPLGWTQVPGSASQVATGWDGNLWALSDQPAGADKYIWRYDGTSWTNISGMAAHLAVTPDGTLYAVNSGGGTYKYSGGAWTALGGGASAITGALDGSIYVLSNGGSGADKAIWHNVNGTWSQLPGSGTSIAASWDSSGPYSVSGGTLSPKGLYILNSVGAIWYENPDNTFVHLPGALPRSRLRMPAESSFWATRRMRAATPSITSM